MGLFTPKISFNNFYDKGRYLLAWRISVLFSILFFVLGLIYFIIEPNAAVPLSSIFVISFSAVLYIKFTKNYKPLFWVYAIAGTIVVHYAMNTIMNFTHYVDFLWITAVVLLAFVGLGLTYGIIFSIINTLGFAYFYIYTINSHVEAMEVRPMSILIGEFIEVVFAFFVIVYLLRQFIIFQKHAQKELTIANSNLEEQNKTILAKNRENETLIKEVHHRVKNNLQIIISLLRMQSSEMKKEEGQTHFNEAINRIMTMSLIHQKLYNAKDLSNIKVVSYFEELVQEIVSSSTEEDVLLAVNSNVTYIDLDTIVPLGLIVNELVSNSIKHAFIEVPNKEITIDIKESENQYIFNYSDNGNWKEKTSDTSSFGLELIDILTEQLDGKRILTNEKGSNYSFAFNRYN